MTGQLSRLENLARFHEAFIERFASRIDHLWALRGRGGRTQLLRFYIVNRVPTFAIRRGWRLHSLTIRGLGVSKQAISKQRKLLREWRDARAMRRSGQVSLNVSAQ